MCHYNPLSTAEVGHYLYWALVTGQSCDEDVACYYWLQDRPNAVCVHVPRIGDIVGVDYQCPHQLGYNTGEVPCSLCMFQCMFNMTFDPRLSAIPVPWAYSPHDGMEARAQKDASLRSVMSWMTVVLTGIRYWIEDADER